MNLSSDRYHEYMERIAEQLNGKFVERLTKAEYNIFQILVEAGYLRSDLLNDKWIVRS